MKIRFNDRMSYYLSIINYDFMIERYNLPSRLEEIVNSPFILNNDCIFLKKLNKVAPRGLNELEKCEYEDAENHFHPDSYMEEDTEIEFLKAGLECGKILSERLLNEYKGKFFRIQISYSESQLIDQEVAMYASSTVRFYQVRPEGEIAMYIPDLNSFKLDAVMEIETIS